MILMVVEYEVDYKYPLQEQFFDAEEHLAPSILC